MAGGIFGRTFALNEKCVVFSLIIIALVLSTPPTFSSDVVQYLFIFAVFVVSYVSMAWYDYYYDCKLMPFRRGNTGITAQLKPPATKSAGNKIEKKRLLTVVYVSHLVIFVPLLLYLAYYGKDANKTAFILAVVLGVFTIAYHCIRMLPLIHGPFGLPAVIYLTHIVLIGPLLIYVGLNKGNYPEYINYALYAIAAGAVYFHGTRLASL